MPSGHETGGPMKNTISKERSLRFLVHAETSNGKPLVLFGVEKTRGPGAPAFAYAGDVREIERFAADLMRAAADARLMALMESRRQPPQRGREARP